MKSIRGITKVLELQLSKALDYSISGLAGIAHILTGLGILFLLSAMQKYAQDIE